MPWRRLECPRFTLPVPVSLNRFAADRLVFIFGIQKLLEVRASAGQLPAGPLAPAADYQTLLAELSSVTLTADRIALLYQGLLPGLAKRYDLYLRTADAILDEPSVRIIERISADTLRMLAQSRELIGQLPQFRCTNSDRARDFGNREATVTVLVAADAGDRRKRA